MTADYTTTSDDLCAGCGHPLHPATQVTIDGDHWCSRHCRDHDELWRY